MESFECISFQKASLGLQLLLDTKREHLHLWQSATPCSIRLASNQLELQLCCGRLIATSQARAKFRPCFFRSTLDKELTVGDASLGRLKILHGMSTEGLNFQSHPCPAYSASQPARDSSRQWLDKETRRKGRRMLQCLIQSWCVVTVSMDSAISFLKRHNFWFT